MFLLSLFRGLFIVVVTGIRKGHAGILVIASEVVFVRADFSNLL